MKLNVIKISQRGYQDKLGTSALTIDQAGCNLACHAMLQNYYGNKIDIVSLNSLFIEKDVYVDRNLIDIFKIQNVNEFIKGKEFINCLTTPAPLKKIDNELTEGRPVIAQVDLNPNQPGPDHFILIFGKTEDGHYICHDPWYKDEDAIFFDARYGDPAKGIFGLRLVSGPVPQPELPKPSIDALTVQVETLKQQIDDVRTALKLPVMADISDITKRIIELLGKEEEYIKHIEQDLTNVEKPDKEHEGFTFAGKWNVNSVFFKGLIEFWKKET